MQVHTPHHELTQHFKGLNYADPIPTNIEADILQFFAYLADS